MTKESKKKNQHDFQILSKALPFSHKRYFQQKILQKIYTFSTNAPYLSGDSFKTLADYTPYGKDGKNKINRYRLTRADVLFVDGNKLSELLENEFQNINAKVLITGNSDKNFTERIQLPNSIKLWLCQNNAISDLSMMRTLPIGIENVRLANLGFKSNYKIKIKDKILNKVIVTPMSPTNVARFETVKWGYENPELADVYREMVPRQDYFRLISKYKFVLCCEGNGFDTHRVWESLYLNNFPILLKTKWSSTLAHLDLPILLVDAYDQINQELLIDFYNKWKEFDSKTERILWIQYWKNWIEKIVETD
jgi:hypothetical protein